MSASVHGNQNNPSHTQVTPPRATPAPAFPGGNRKPPTVKSDVVGRGTGGNGNNGGGNGNGNDGPDLVVLFENGLI